MASGINPSTVVMAVSSTGRNRVACAGRREGDPITDTIAGEVVQLDQFRGQGGGLEAGQSEVVGCADLGEGPDGGHHRPGGVALDGGRQLVEGARAGLPHQCA